MKSNQTFQYSHIIRCSNELLLKSCSQAFSPHAAFVTSSTNTGVRVRKPGYEATYANLHVKITTENGMGVKKTN